MKYFIKGIGILFLLSGLAMLWLLVLGLVKFSLITILSIGLILILGIAITGGGLESDNSGRYKESDL